MSHFYGIAENLKTRRASSRAGNKDGGILVAVASAKGTIRVVVKHNPATGDDEFEIRLGGHIWDGSTGGDLLFSGFLDTR